MTPEAFRSLALHLPEALESEHQGHPDFRVAGKIFATLGPQEDWAMVKLSPPEQAALVQQDARAFQPIAGAWGARGCTRVELAKATKALVRRALNSAWRNTAPKKLAEQHNLEGV